MLLTFVQVAVAGVRCDRPARSFTDIDAAIDGGCTEIVLVEPNNDAFESPIERETLLRSELKNQVVADIRGQTRVEVQGSGALTMQSVRFPLRSSIEVKGDGPASQVVIHHSEIHCSADVDCVTIEDVTLELSDTTVSGGDLQVPAIQGIDDADLHLVAPTWFEFGTIGAVVDLNNGSLTAVSEGEALNRFTRTSGTAVSLHGCSNRVCAVDLEATWFLGDGVAVDAQTPYGVGLRHVQVCGGGGAAVQVQGGAGEVVVEDSAFGVGTSGSRFQVGVQSVRNVVVARSTFWGLDAAVAAPGGQLVQSVFATSAVAVDPTIDFTLTDSVVGRETIVPSTASPIVEAELVALTGKETGGVPQCAEFRYHPRLHPEEPWPSPPVVAGVYTNETRDGDGDGAPWRFDCADLAGDPGNSLVHALQTELPYENDLDDDCDGLVDCQDDDLDVTLQVDKDHDTYTVAGGEGCLLNANVRPSIEPDCDDADAAINPDVDEDCGPIDRNCDRDPIGGAIDASVMVYPDRDGDGFGDDDAGTLVCVPGPDDQATGGDCADDDGDRNPAMTEVFNDNIDQDCDGADAVAGAGGGGGCDQGRSVGGSAFGFALLGSAIRRSRGSSGRSTSGRAQKS